MEMILGAIGGPGGAGDEDPGGDIASDGEQDHIMADSADHPHQRSLFSEISKNWSAEPLVSYEKMLKFIRNTRTQTGLLVTANLNRANYPTGVKPARKKSQTYALRVAKYFRIGITPLLRISETNFAWPLREFPYKAAVGFSYYFRYRHWLDSKGKDRPLLAAITKRGERGQSAARQICHAIKYHVNECLRFTDGDDRTHGGLQRTE
jgi:hypothetical protein